MTTTWTISGQNGLTGTVTQAQGSGLEWNLIAPTGTTFPDGSSTKYLYYGSVTALPYTYVDGNGLDQMVVIDGVSVHFDQEYTSGFNKIVMSATNIIPTRGTTNAGGTTGLISLQTWKIQGERGLTGIVTLSPEVGLLWNLKPASGITLPSTISTISTTPLLPSGMSSAVPYGGPLTMPVIYIQSGGSYNNTDQMAVYQIGGFGSGIDYALDRDYTGGYGETYATSADVTVISTTTGYARKIHYPVDIMPVLSILANPTLVTVGAATDVTFTVTSSGSAANGATVTLTGVITGSGTTNSSGITIISVNATNSGTITATASKTGYTNGSTTITASATVICTVSAVPNELSALIGDIVIITISTTPSSAFSVNVYQNNGITETLIDTISCNSTCFTIWDTTGLTADTYSIYAKIGTQCESSRTDVTLTDVAEASVGGGSGMIMLVGLGIAALLVMNKSVPK